MNLLTRAAQWLAGGDRPYMTLYHCMNHDHLWVAITVGLDLIVAAGYMLIALHWARNSRTLPNNAPAKRALANMRDIFVFCGICGYAFIPIKMFWPAWRLYDGFLVVLAVLTWRYAWSARDLKVVYNELGRNTRLSEDLLRTREEVRQKNFFLNAISHDLRTPLNGLVLNANLAEISLSSDDSDGVRQAVEQMKGGARSAAAMLGTFLEYTRLEAEVGVEALTEFRLADAVAEVVRSFGPQASEKRLFLRERTPDILFVRTDRQKLVRALSNLVDNAVKFTGNGGVRIESEAAGGGVEIHVIDTGAGVSVEHRERLFDEFFQIGNIERDRRKGFGMGLAICRRLARQLGGDVLVESVVGQGSRFTVVLPSVVVPAAGIRGPAGTATGHAAAPPVPAA